MTIQTFQPQVIPLTRWDDGTIRVGETRVLLDLVIYAFNEGRTPEEIVIQYPSLQLAEVYGAITYYLANRVALDVYVREREQEAERLWAKIEADPNQKDIRARLLARQTNNR